MTSSICIALRGTLVGHLLVLIAIVMDNLSPAMAISAAVGCSLLAIATLGESEPSDTHARRTVTGLRRAHVVVAAIMVSGLVPHAPEVMLTVAIAGAAVLGGVCIAMVQQTAIAEHPSRLRTLAPRVAAIALVAESALVQWGIAGKHESDTWLTAIYLACIVAVRVVALEALSIVVLRLRSRWALVGLLFWIVGWAAITADLVAFTTWLLGGPFPVGSRQLRRLDPSLVQLFIILGGALIGAALVAASPSRRPRRAAVILLTIHVASGVLIAIEEHLLEHATELGGITSLRSTRDAIAATAAVTFAGMLWLHQRNVSVSNLPRAKARAAVTTSSSQA